MTKKKESKYNSIITTIVIILLIVAAIVIIYEIVLSDIERREIEKRIKLAYSNNWDRVFCLEQGYEDYSPSNSWAYSYCKQGKLLIKFEKTWNYTGGPGLLQGKRDKIIGGRFVAD